MSNRLNKKGNKSEYTGEKIEEGDKGTYFEMEEPFMVIH